jgi:hypothetical protein
MRFRRLLKRPNRFNDGRQHGSAAQPQSAASTPHEGAAAGAAGPLQPHDGSAATGPLLPHEGPAGAAQPVSQPLSQHEPMRLNRFGRGIADQLMRNRKSTSFGRAHGSQQAEAVAASLPQPGPAAGASQQDGAQPQPPIPNIRSSRSPAKLWLVKAKEAATTNNIDLIFIETRLRFPIALSLYLTTVWGVLGYFAASTQEPTSLEHPCEGRLHWPGPAATTLSLFFAPAEAAGANRL